MTTTAAVAPVTRAAVVTTRRRAASAMVTFRSCNAAMGRGDPAAETCRSSTTTMERAGLAAAKLRSRNIAIGGATGRGQSAAARSARAPATRGIGRDLRRGRLASASATALCRAIRHRIGLAGCLVVLRMMRPPAATRTLCAGTIRCSNRAGDAGAAARCKPRATVGHATARSSARAAAARRSSRCYDPVAEARLASAPCMVNSMPQTTRDAGVRPDQP
jgi:hypothetical protein